MIVLLFVVAILGGTGLALILSPDGSVGRSAARAAWLIPIAIAIATAAVQTSLKGRRWNPDSPEVKTILQDEFRRTNMDRAARISLIVVLAAQWPLGLLTLITLFLFFDRE